MAWTVIKDGKRQCIVCDGVKPLSEFYCYAYTTAQGKRSKRRESACKSCKSEKCKIERSKIPERHKSQSKAWREKNHNKMIEYQKAYRESEHGRRKRAQLQLKRWHKQRSAEGEYTQVDIDRIFAQQQGKCVYCRSNIADKYTIDHIEPISRGGTNWPKNLQLTCKSCNCSKQHKDPIDYAKSIGRLI